MPRFYRRAHPRFTPRRPAYPWAPECVVVCPPGFAGVNPDGDVNETGGFPLWLQGVLRANAIARGLPGLPGDSAGVLPFFLTRRLR